MRNRFQRLRPWLALAGIMGVAAVLAPPVATLARHYVLAQAAQFAVLAVVAPALIVLGAPWRAGRPRRSRTADPAGRAPGRSLADRAATARSHRPAGAMPWLVLVGFIAVALAWRLPVAVDALVRHPILTAAEAVTLLAAGCALWLELVESPPLLPRTSRPQRAAFAALPMWAIWASAYIMGFSGTDWFSALAHAPGHGLGTIADQEIAAFLLWVIPGLCFVPVVYVALITWLRDGADSVDELRSGEGDQPGAGLPVPRPPRGWRQPTT